MHDRILFWHRTGGTQGYILGASAPVYGSRYVSVWTVDRTGSSTSSVRIVSPGGTAGCPPGPPDRRPDGVGVHQKRVGGRRASAAAQRGRCARDTGPLILGGELRADTDTTLLNVAAWASPRR